MNNAINFLTIFYTLEYVKAGVLCNGSTVPDCGDCEEEAFCNQECSWISHEQPDDIGGGKCIPVGNFYCGRGKSAKSCDECPEQTSQRCDGDCQWNVSGQWLGGILRDFDDLTDQPRCVTKGKQWEISINAALDLICEQNIAKNYPDMDSDEKVANTLAIVIVTRLSSIFNVDTNPNAINPNGPTRTYRRIKSEVGLGDVEKNDLGSYGLGAMAYILAKVSCDESLKQWPSKIFHYFLFGSCLRLEMHIAAQYDLGKDTELQENDLAEISEVYRDVCAHQIFPSFQKYEKVFLNPKNHVSFIDFIKSAICNRQMSSARLEEEYAFGSILKTLKQTHLSVCDIIKTFPTYKIQTMLCVLMSADEKASGLNIIQNLDEKVQGHVNKAFPRDLQHKLHDNYVNYCNIVTSPEGNNALHDKGDDNGSIRIQLSILLGLLMI